MKKFILFTFLFLASSSSYADKLVRINDGMFSQKPLNDVTDAPRNHKESPLLADSPFVRLKPTKELLCLNLISTLF